MIKMPQSDVEVALDEVFDHVYRNGDPLLVRRPEGADVVILCASDYRNMERLMDQIERDSPGILEEASFALLRADESAEEARQSMLRFGRKPATSGKRMKIPARKAARARKVASSEPAA